MFAAAPTCAPSLSQQEDPVVMFRKVMSAVRTWIAIPAAHLMAKMEPIPI